ncbi:S8 family serine peptidase [Lacticaseibacillus suilingensis]|uniref:S8 family serine peptidase n=1 Tax=Lacticaseibacillus suilingensis TaxID=2799577 RepID=A0ABW4BHY7_9LACO|nr:S8 family serine peptidase [Lacticaseibacillus suilingensis]
MNQSKRKHKVEHLLLLSTLILGFSAQAVADAQAVQAAITASAPQTTVTQASNLKTPTKDDHGVFKINSQQTLADAVRAESKAAADAGNALVWTKIKAQLEAKGIDTSDLKLGDTKNETVRVVVNTTGKAGVDTVKSDDPTYQEADAAEDKALAAQADTTKAAEKLTGNKVEEEFGYLVKGFSIDAKVSDLSKLEALDGVKSIEVSSVQTPQDISADKTVHAVQAWEQQNVKGEGMAVAIIDSGMDPTHKDFRLSDDSTAKISKADAEAKIADFGYGKYESAKVPFAHNYADGNDEEVYDTTGEMHGQHVAGIVGANGENPDNVTSVVGVAPEAQLLDMKVFNNMGTGVFSDVIVQAIEDSVKLGADVMNMSFGSDNANANISDVENDAIASAADEGVVAVIAAGNSGNSTGRAAGPIANFNALDDGLMSTPGISEDAITVASSDNTTWTSYGTSITHASDGSNPFGKAISVEPNSDLVSATETLGHFPTAQMVAVPNESGYEDVVAGLGAGADADYKNVNVEGKIAVVSRGGNSEVNFAAKKTAAAAHGAVGLIVINNSGVGDGEAGLATGLPTIFTNMADGQKLVEDLKAHPNEFYKFSTFAPTIATKATGNQMSYFTTWGPNTDLALKPDITAPGGHLWSTANDNGYQDMSGTSMATPVTAGSTALVMQGQKANGVSVDKRDRVTAAKLAMMNTSVPILDQAHNNTPYSPRRQGSGLVQISEALKSTVSMTVKGKGAASLKEIDNKATFTIKLKNNGQSDVAYNFNDFGGVYTKATDDDKNIYDKHVAGSTLTADQDEFVLQAGDTKEIKVTLTLPTGFHKSQWAEGFVGFKSNTAGSPDLSMAFLGFYGNWDSAQKIFDGIQNTRKSIYPLETAYTMEHGNMLLDNNKSILGWVWDSAIDEKSSSLEGNSWYDPNYVAISPNGDGTQNTATPYVSLNRNAKKVEGTILDAEGNVVQTVGAALNGSKSYISGHGDHITTSLYLNDDHLIFTGKTYDPTTGQEETLPDGQYTYRLTANLDSDDGDTESQSIDLPIKVDTTAPEFSNVQLVKNADGKWHVTGTVTDATAGLSPLSPIAVSINGFAITAKLDTSISAAKDFNTVEDFNRAVQNTYQFDTDISDIADYIKNGTNNVQVAAIDNAGNAGTGETKATVDVATNSNSLVLFNVYDGETTDDTDSYYNKDDKTYTIYGNYKNDFYINGEAVKVDDEGNFEAHVTMHDALDKLVFSQDAKQNIVIKTMKFGFAQQPVVTLDQPAGGSWYDLVDGTQIWGVNNTAATFNMTGSISGSPTDVVAYGQNVDGSTYDATSYNLDQVTKKFVATFAMISGSHAHEGENVLSAQAYTSIDGVGEVDGPQALMLVLQTDQTYLSFDNVFQGSTINISKDNEKEINYDEATQTLTITGVAGNQYTAVEDFKILGHSMDPDDPENQVTVDPTTHKFSYKVKVSADQVRYITYQFKTRDLQTAGAKTSDDWERGSFGVGVDTTFPTLDFDTGDHWQASASDDYDYEVYTNKDSLELKGKFGDNLTGYTVKIGSDEVYQGAWNQTLSADYLKRYPQDSYQDQTFDKELPLTATDDSDDLVAGNGASDNVFVMTVTDNYGNKTERKILVHQKKADLDAPVVTPSTTALTNGGVDLTATQAQDADIQYSLDNGQTWHAYNGAVAKAIAGDIQFKASDEYGNESPVTTYTVKNIVNQIAAQPTAQLSDFSADTKAVTVTLGYDKDLTEAQKAYTHLRYSLDDGATWLDYTAPFAVDQTTKVLVQSYDDAGNESDEITATVVIPEAQPEDEQTQTKDDDADQTKNDTGNTAGVDQDADDQSNNQGQGQDNGLGQAGKRKARTHRGSGVTSSTTSTKQQARGSRKGTLPSTGEQVANNTLTGLLITLLSGLGLIYVGGKKRNEEK